MNNVDIASPVFTVFGYINNFHMHENSTLDKPTWYARLSLIVDRNTGEDKETAPFLFQNCSLIIRGTAYQLVNMHKNSEGANLAWCQEDGKNKLYQFDIKGYRAVPSGKSEYPIDIKGRLVRIEDPYEDV